MQILRNLLDRRAAKALSATIVCAALGVITAPQNAAAQIVSSPSSGCAAANAGDFDFSQDAGSAPAVSPFTDEFAQGEVLTFSLLVDAGGGVISAIAEDLTAAVEILNATASTSEDYSIPASGDRDFNLQLTPSDDFGSEITVTCTPAEEGSITITKDSGGVDGDFNFEGDLGAFAITVLGEPSPQSFSDLSAGVYTVREVVNPDFELTGLSCTGDLDNGSVINLAENEVAIDLDPGEDIICTFSNTSAQVIFEGQVAEFSTHAIRNYLYRRANALLSEQPDRARIVRKKPGLLWENGDLNIQANDNGVDANFAASSGRVWGNDFDLWVEGHYSSYEYDNGSDAEGDFGVIYVGADYLLTEDLLIGALAQFDWASDTSAAMGEDVSGNGWMIGPYVSARLHKNLFFDARAAWGQSDNELTIAGFVSDDEFDTTRWLMRGALTGNHQFDNWRLTPTVAVAYMEERQDSYVSGTGVTIGEQTVALGRASFEPELAYRHITEGGVLIEPQLRLAGLWDFETPEGLSIPGWEITTDEFRMRAEAGVMVAFPSGFALRAAGSFDGIGAEGYEAYGGRIWLDIPFGAPPSSVRPPSPAPPSPPPAPAPVAPPPDMSATLGFKTGKPTLSSESYDALADLWSAASGEDVATITIETGGGDAALAAQRGDVIKDVLLNLGAPADRITIVPSDDAANVRIRFR